MRQPIRLIVKKGKLRLDGTRLVSVQYCHSSTSRVVISTGVAIPPKYWNRKTGRISRDLPPEFGNVEELENILFDKLRKAQDMLKYVEQNKVGCPMLFLKSNFHLSHRWEIRHMKPNKEDLDVFSNIDRYIEDRKSQVRQCTTSQQFPSCLTVQQGS